MTTATLSDSSPLPRGAAPGAAPGRDAGAEAVERPGATPADGGPDGPRIGPNSLIQTRRALGELHGPDTAEALYRWARCPEEIPDEMVDEAQFIRLVLALRGGLGAEGAAQVMARAGRHTAGYIQRNRIPVLVRRAVALLPTRAGLRVLLGGIQRHAWTFVGGGDFECVWGSPPEIRIQGCPTCRDFELDEPGGIYYAVAFESLLTRLLRCTVRVRERTCTALGDPLCTFTIELDGGSRAGAPTNPDSPDGELPCAS